MKTLALITIILMGFSSACVGAEPPGPGAGPNIPPLVLNISSRPVGEALNEFAAQSGLQVVLYTEVAGNIVSQAVTGEFSSATAGLRAMIEDTGLCFSYLNENTIGVETCTDKESTVADGEAGQLKHGLSKLEEVVVTAGRRPQNLQDIPNSVVALSAAAIEARSLVTLSDLGQFVPNVSFFQGQTGGKYSSTVFIRGVGQIDTNNPGRSPRVGVYIDGIYLGRAQGLDIDLTNIERVEVLRGPQGTLFGKNTIGGAISIVSKLPEEDLSGMAQLILGNYNRQDARFDINVPLVKEKLTARLAVASRNQDGYGKRLEFGSSETLAETGDTDRLSTRSVFHWTPAESFDALLSLDSSRVRERGAPRKVLEFFDEGNFIDEVYNQYVDPPYGDVFRTRGDYDSFATGADANELDSQGGSLTLSWDLGSFDLKSITGYRDSEAFNGADPDGSPHVLVDATHTMIFDQISQEVQLQGLSFAGRLFWVTGMYYFDENAEQESISIIAKELYEATGEDLSITIEDRATTRSVAMFAQGTYDFSEQYSVTAGLRYTSEKKTLASEIGREFEQEVLESSPRETADFDMWTGRLALEYHWDERVMSYFSVSEGVASGGLNSLVRGLETYDPEEMTTYELGLKTQFFDGAMVLNATLFHSDYDDIQFTVTRVGEDLQPVTFIGNAANARVQGVEVDFMAIPTEGFTLAASLGYIDARYLKGDPGSNITRDTPFLLTPEWSGTVSAEYARALTGGDRLTGRVDYSYKSRTEHTLNFSTVTSQEPYGLLNARLSYTSRNQKWEGAIFATNLLDERYSLAATGFIGLGFIEVQYGPPAMWGLDLKYLF